MVIQNNLRHLCYTAHHLVRVLVAAKLPNSTVYPDFAALAQALVLSQDARWPYVRTSPKASRQWVVENSDKEEGLGVVPIPPDRQDGLVTHARYMVECPHFDDDDENCSCKEDETAMWELEAFEG